MGVTTNINEVIEQISDEVRQHIQRTRLVVAEAMRRYFEQVRQRMPALTGNAVSAVTFSIEETAQAVTITITQEGQGASGDPIGRYMPRGILGKAPHTSGHSELEEKIALAKVGRVVLNPSAAQDPWLQAANDLGFTNFQREGESPTFITFEIPATALENG